MQLTQSFRRTLAVAFVGSVLGCGSDSGSQRSGDDFAVAADEDGEKERDAGSKKDGKVTKPSETGKTDGGTKPVTPDDGTNKCAGIRQDAPPASGGVDVIFLIDTSGSMLHAITQVQENMAAFVQNFEGTAADTRVVVITGADPAAGTPVAGDTDKYRFIPSGVDSGALFTVALAQYGAYEDFLRPSATTMFVMVTDDEDFLPPAEFRSAMEAQLGHSFIQHAIASEDVNGLPCISEAQAWNPLCATPIPAVCAAAAIGRNYYQLADDTGGVKQSICKADWVPVFDELRAAVIEAVPLPCSYPLANASTATLDPEKVQVVYTPSGGDDDEFPRANTQDACGTKNGWYYDNNDSPTTIQLCPTACETVAAGGTLDVAFGCPPIFVM
ncbi:MAG TPA: vWA domain-containing protein [Polyangiales bacterium]|nr:vWA domain-containing protein [Polyangiales bacterium]